MIKLMQGCCLERMKEIPDGSVDMVLTDPPYGTMNNAGLDGWENNKTSWDNLIDQGKMLEECNRVLRVNGSLLLFSQDPFTGELMTKQHGNLPFSYRMTWLKDHFANALIAKKAPVNYTEDICVFFKKYDQLNQHPLRVYANDIMRFLGMTLKEINADLGHRRAEHFFYIESTQFGLCTEATYNELIEKYNIDRLDSFITYRDMEAINRRFSRRFNLPQGEKYKSNVLSYKKDYQGLHPTQKPVLLLEDLIKTYTNEGETVLDFTCGSGSTGVAAKNLNRSFIGIELSSEYFEIARNRIGESNE
jgi:site-specific DNA-methyltransferase (adenine-specific)